jgi:hypothetical protein
MSQLPRQPESVHLFDEEELQDLCSSIAESIAALSEPCEAPTGFDLTTEPLNADDVDFSSNGWLLRVSQVQTWLHLDETLSRSDIEDDSTQAAHKLFLLLGQEQPDRCFTGAEGTVRLTALGADVLNSRLDVASKLRDQFEEHCEDTNRKDATANWHAAWEEEEPEESEPRPIKAKTSQWLIRDFAGNAADGILNLSPSYQRGDVWKTPDAQKLIESVLRGIPLPSVILLNPVSATGQFEVVDGKQRLTALLRFIGQHPTALEHVRRADEAYPDVDFAKHFHANYRKFKRLWKQHMGDSLTASRERDLYFPFPLPKQSKGLRGSLEVFGGKYYCEVRTEEIQLPDRPETAKKVFDGVSDYKIPVIEYIDATPRQIHDVFHLYNRQGKHLNAEEIRNAVFHEIDLARLLLVASGDNPRPRDLVAFLPDELDPALTDIADALANYRFGSLRYKRTKVLSWVASILLQPALDGGELQVRSTARHINTLLEQIRDDSEHPLQSHKRLAELVRRLHETIEAHSEHDNVWDGTFKDTGSGTKWQELQLVASLVGTFLLAACSDDLDSAISTSRGQLLSFTRSNPRPRKTQNKTQWAYIGHISLGILEAGGKSADDADAALDAQFSVSCVPTLLAARRAHRPGD